MLTICKKGCRKRAELTLRQPPVHAVFDFDSAAIPDLRYSQAILRYSQAILRYSQAILRYRIPRGSALTEPRLGVRAADVQSAKSGVER